ncbi:MAG: hypothetical protein RLZZ381_1130, partial [Cyanobacteriota bacterium]
MNRFFPLVSAIGVVAIITFPSQSALALERSEIAAKAKEFTVQIDGEETGTGTIIERNGNSYKVITCWHVVDTPGKYQVITLDGKQYQATEIKNLPNADLATIEFTSSTNYQTAKLGNSQTIAPGTSAYVVGYPDPIPGIPERTYTFLDAAVISQLAKEDKGYTIIHDNPSTPGGSGGGMFDSNGSLIGINGKSISDANTTKVYGAGIPLELYITEQASIQIPNNIQLPQDFLSQGKRKEKEGNYENAIVFYNQFLEQNPNNIDAYYGRAKSYYSLKQYQLAINDFNEIIKLNPNYINVYALRGLAYYDQKNYPEALADFNQAIDLDPNSFYAYNNRGRVYLEQKNYPQALANFNQAIDLDPNSFHAYRNRGLVHYEQKNYPQALADFNQAIDLNPDFADTYNDRGRIYLEQKNYPQALANFNQAIDLDPNYFHAYRNRGLVYYDQKNYSQALTNFNQAIKINPDFADAYNNRGLVYS